MIRDIRSYYSCNNKTLRSLRRNRHRYDILDVADINYYCTISRCVRNKRYPTLREREYININITNQFYNQHSFYHACTKYILTHRLMGLRESLILKGDE